MTAPTRTTTRPAAMAIWRWRFEVKVRRDKGVLAKDDILSAVCSSRFLPPKKNERKKLEKGTQRRKEKEEKKLFF